MKLNLGCGPKRIPGYVGVDKEERVKPDLIADFEEGLPFKTDSVDQIYASHLLEHITNFNPLMEEIFRVCKPGARVEIRAPYGLSEEGIADTTHVRLLCLHTFDYFDRSSWYSDIYNYNCNLKVERAERIGDGIHLELRAIKNA